MFNNIYMKMNSGKKYIFISRNDRVTASTENNLIPSESKEKRYGFAIDCKLI